MDEIRKLNYIGEHLTCRKYIPRENAAFVVRDCPAGSSPDISSGRNHLLLFMEGECEAYGDSFGHRRFHAGEIAAVGAGTLFRCTAAERMLLIDMRFDTPEGCCEKMDIGSYTNVRTGAGHGAAVLEMRRPIPEFCRMLAYSLGGGLSCAHFHGMKQQELMLYLRAYYTKEELAGLFAPVIERDMDFRNFIQRNHARVDSLGELITMSNMSRRTFFRRFKNEFGTTAYRWMLKQTAHNIAREFSRADATPGEIAEKMGFDSASNFCNFCKRTMGLSPTELKRKYGGGEPAREKSDA